MAGIGMYGVFYAKCKKENGITTGYTGGIQQAGKAVSANFTPTTPEDNPLYANNAIAENDTSSGSGGTLAMVLDRLTQATAADLFGLTVEETSVEVGSETVKGTALRRYGNEQSVPVGIAYIKAHQMDNQRNFHEVVFYRSVTFPIPEDVANTMEGSISWQKVSLEGTVDGLEGEGKVPWFESVMFPTQDAAMEYIYSKLKETEADV